MNVGRRLAELAAVFLFLLGAASFAGAQTTWPQEITDPEGTIVVYQPQPEKLTGNVLSGRPTDRGHALLGRRLVSPRAARGPRAG